MLSLNGSSVSHVRFRWFVLPAGFLACLLMAGCAQRVYGPGPPPPPFSSLVAQADQSGYQTGFADGVRDARNGLGYHPRRDRKYAETPGYSPAMGPYGPYRDNFRRAYLRGYAEGFRGR